MQKKYYILLTFLYLNICFAQNTNIGINTITPNASAVLDISSLDKGMLLPRVSLVNISNSTTPILNPAVGLLVWNNNASVIGGNGIGIYYFNGSNWISLKENSTLDNAYDKNGAGLGRTIIADAGAVKVAGTDGIFVSGTHTSGTTISSETTGAGSRMFYNPNKSAFRAGFVTSNQFDLANVGNFSGAFGSDNQIFGGRNFGANYNNRTSAVNASSLGFGNNSNDNATTTIGNTTTASGNNAFASGFTTFASGYNSFVAGVQNRSSTLAEISLGHNSRNKSKTVDTSPTFDQTTDSASNFYTTDALFSVGKGTDTSNRKNALFIDKSGKIEINEEYKLPLTDGTTNQVLYTDGNDNLAWRNKIVDVNTTNLPMYLAENAYSFANTTPNINLGNITTSLNPLEFSTTGAIKIKVLIKYSTQTGTQSIRLVDDLGNVIVGSGQFTALYPTIDGGILSSNWVNYTNLSIVSLHLNGSNSTSGSMNIESVYLLIQKQ